MARIRQVDEEEDEALVVAVCYISQNHPVDGLSLKMCYNH